MRGTRLLCLAIGSSALLGCWDSVARPIRIAVDGSPDVDSDAATGAPRDAGGGFAGDGPDLRYCDLANWSEESARAELALFAAINDLRATGGRCAGREFGQAPPLQLAPELRCAARLYSAELATRGRPSQESEEQRVGRTGVWYPWIDEVLVFGTRDPAQVLEWLRESRGDNREECARILNPNATAIGIGLYRDQWTLELGAR